MPRQRRSITELKFRWGSKRENVLKRKVGFENLGKTPKVNLGVNTGVVRKNVQKSESLLEMQEKRNYVPVLLLEGEHRGKRRRSN